MEVSFRSTRSHRGVGISGAMGGQPAEEACARAAIDAISSELRQQSKLREDIKSEGLLLCLGLLLRKPADGHDKHHVAFLDGKRRGDFARSGNRFVANP